MFCYKTVCAGKCLHGGSTSPALVPVMSPMTMLPTHLFLTRPAFKLLLSTCLLPNIYDAMTSISKIPKLLGAS